MLSRLTIPIPIVLALAGGCAHGQAYPVAPAVAEPPVASSYGIPASAPQGSVNVLSFGPERLATAPGQPDTYLHVRLAVENTADPVPWTAVAADQGLAADGRAPVGPAFAESSSNGPVLTVAPGSRGTLDLFFTLPDRVEPARIAVAWRLQRGTETVAQTTRFERQATANQAIVYYRPLVGADVYLGIGPDWWYTDWGWYGRFAWRHPHPSFAPVPVYVYPRRPLYAVPARSFARPLAGAPHGFARSGRMAPRGGHR